MSEESKSLENKAWYRVLKVLYGFGWITVLLITGFAFLILKPSSFVDLSKSTFYCPEKVTSYSLENAKGLYSRSDKYLNMEDHLITTKTCGMQLIGYNREGAKAAGLSDKEIDSHLSKLFDTNSDDFKKSFQNIEVGRKNPKYQINFVYYDTFMNWIKSLGWVSAVFIVAIFVLNLIRDIVLYITIGKKFSYRWLISNKESKE